MSRALYVGIALQDEQVSVVVMDTLSSVASSPIVFPATEFGVQGVRNFLLCYMGQVQLAVAIAGKKAVEFALDLGMLMVMQVFIINNAFAHEALALAKYARHVA